MDPPPPYTPLPGSTTASPDPHTQRYQYQPYSPPPLPVPPRQTPPQLPPRPPSSQLSVSESKSGHGRSASQVSIVPESDSSKRTLLIIYIHGFMGNETSFQSFPTHLHNLLCVTLGPLGYLVHTKVYPKFKTRYNILVATENFSQWLSKFENDNTDVILLGHSMGGLLAAEVALLQDYMGRKRHRILGTISFDSPFLGMHPGVISAGLGSIFRPAPKSPGEDTQGLYANNGEGSSSSMSLHTMNSGGSQVDEFYSKLPARNYTVIVPKKEGTWDSTLHFINKYQSRLTQATGQYLMSHLEFGGCLADIRGLKNRYSAIRALEDGVVGSNGNTERIRFVNYYTSSTGRIKENTGASLPPGSTALRSFDGQHGVPGADLDHDLIGYERSSQYIEVGVIEGGQRSKSPITKHRRNASVSSYNTASSVEDMKHISTDPITDDGFDEPVALHIIHADDISVVDGKPPTELLVHEKIQYSNDEKRSYSEDVGYIKEYGYSGNGEPSYPPNDITRQTTTETMESGDEKPSLDLMLEESQLPPIPPPPEEPPSFDYSQIPDPTVRKVAEKEAVRVRKLWEKAVKDYEKAVRNREKSLEKLRKNKGKAVSRGCKEKEKRRDCESKDRGKEIERRERDRRKELKEWDKEKDREEKEIQKRLKEEDKEREITDRERLNAMRGWEREKEREEREVQREQEKKEREIVRELERMEKEIELEKGRIQSVIDHESDRRVKELAIEEETNGREEVKSGGNEENTHEKQELERLRKEQERMEAEYRRMNSIPEPPVQPYSPSSALPSTAANTSASSSLSNLSKLSPTLAPEIPASISASPRIREKGKGRRDRRFCCLPKEKNDKCWVKVEMNGVDEVGAHCGIFFVGAAYERLVGDVAARMEEWVGEERTRRILESL